ATVVEYLAATHRYTEAKERVGELERYDVSFEEVEHINNLIHVYQLDENLKQYQEKSSTLPEAVERIEPTLSQQDIFLEPKDQAYAFLYNEELWEIDLQELTKTLAQDKEGLIKEGRRI